MNRTLSVCLVLTSTASFLAQGCSHCCNRTPTAACTAFAAPNSYPVYQPLPAPPRAVSPVVIPGAAARIPAYPPPAAPTPSVWLPPSGARPQEPTPQPHVGARLQVPDFAPAPPRVSEGQVRATEPTPRVTESETRPPSPALPPGIPQYVLPKDQVAAGLRPLLDGWDWLKEKGYKTVLHVRRPGEDNTADRQEVEGRGLRYLSIEVSPESLSQAIVDQFSHVVSDPANYRLFVYDKDGTLAGGLWYLHFRLAEKLPDAEARTKAAPLGFKEDAAGEGRLMTLAVQKLLSELNAN